LALNDYLLDGHAAQQITAEWFADLDLVLAMDSANFRDLQTLARRAGINADLHMLRAFDPALAHLTAPHPELDVPDPYYGGDDGFTEVLAMIEAAADGLITQLPAQLGR
jgi:protein-tyrosine phosphatase